MAAATAVTYMQRTCICQADWLCKRHKHNIDRSTLIEWIGTCDSRFALFVVHQKSVTNRKALLWKQWPHPLLKALKWDSKIVLWEENKKSRVLSVNKLQICLNQRFELDSASNQVRQVLQDSSTVTWDQIASVVQKLNSVI